MNDRERREEADRLLKEGALSPLGEGMAATHEMFLGLKEGGFSELQALWIIGYVISSGSEKTQDDE